MPQEIFSSRGSGICTSTGFMPGTFHSSSPTGSPAYVRCGDSLSTSNGERKSPKACCSARVKPSPEPPIDGPEPFYPGTISVSNEDEARQAVRRVKESGADFIEVDLRLPREAYFVIADESRKLGISFAGGCHLLSGRSFEGRTKKHRVPRRCIVRYPVRLLEQRRRAAKRQRKSHGGFFAEAISHSLSVGSPQ